MPSRSFSTTLFAALLVLTMNFNFGCNTQAKTVSHKFPAHMKVFFTANTLGSVFPCGCHVPLGGLSRRAGVISKDKPDYPNQLIVDAGSFTGGTGAFNKLTADYLIKGYALIGYNAINIGLKETENSLEQLKQWDTDSGGKLVSANVLDQKGNPATHAYVIAQIDQIKVGITGMTKAGRQPEGSTGLAKVVDPVPELKKVLAEFKKNNVDYMVLLADLSRGEIDGILAQAPGFNLVVQGQEFSLRDPDNSQKEGDTRVVKIGAQGKYLGWIRFDFKDTGEVTSEETGYVELDNTVPTQSDISTLLVQYKQELRNDRNDILLDPANPFQQAGTVDYVDILSGFAGPKHCGGCHLGYSLDQQEVGHFNAWNNLEDQGKTNVACLPCHTTGYGLPTGLQDPYRDAHLTGVTCESCHGPGAIHARDEMAKDKGVDPATMLPAENPTGLSFSKEVPEAVCLKCHTKEWSPNFDYATWVKRINHSSVKNKPEITNPDTGESVAPEVPDDSGTSTGN